MIKNTQGLIVVMADTSYSDMKASDNRGKAVSEVIVQDTDSLSVHGVTNDEAMVKYVVNLRSMLSGKVRTYVNDAG